jgi:hypothetical protein
MTGFTTKQYTDRRRPPWLWPVVVLAAVIVVAVVVGFSLSDGGGPPAAQQGTPAPTSAGSAPPPPPPAGPAGGADSGSTHQPNDPNYLTAVPAGLRFQDVGGLTLPFSPVDGPLRVNGPIAAGYSHTPQGAVIAAMQLAQRIAFGPDYRQVVGEQVTGDPSVKATIINYRATHPQDNPAQLAAELAPPVGFRVETYTPDRATVVLLNHPGSNAGGFVAGRGAVVWSDGDWKVPVDSPTTSSPVTDTTGYTLF